MKVDTLSLLMCLVLFVDVLGLFLNGIITQQLQRPAVYKTIISNSKGNYTSDEMLLSIPKETRELQVTADSIYQKRVPLYHPSTKREKSPMSRQEELDTNHRLSTSYLVDTPFCKIPNFSPFHSKFRNFERTLESAVCERNASVVYQSGFFLKVNQTVVQLPPYNGTIKFCKYIPIVRPKFTPTHKNFIRYLNVSKPFKFSIKVPHEFVQVNCFNKENKSVYINFHAFAQPNLHLYKMFKRRSRTHKLKHSLNAMLVGLDSVSRLSFLRHMVKTRSFLTDKLAAFEMVGYNKVADNTLVNMLPLTLGKFLDEIPWVKNKTFDEFNFIWKQYSERGYRTFFAEDRPAMSTFNYLNKGFNTPPGEHYYRPMSLAMAQEKDLWYNYRSCFKDRLEAEIILNYNYDFVETYRNNSYFSFNFLSGMTHDRPNGGSAVDERYYKFFKRLHDNDLIRNTVIFFFSDHGIRFGPARKGFVGKLEERLPFMYVIVPKWLRDSYPNTSHMLSINQNRLSTPFDVYETLKDILFFDRLSKHTDGKSRGVSWFQEIPYTRSCETAGILPHWCTCLKHKKLHINTTLVVSASFEALNAIKQLLSQYDSICEELSIYQIKEATHIFVSDEILLGSKGNIKVENYQLAVEIERRKSTEDVQVLIETVPGNALFEATVRAVHSKTRVHYSLVGDISRINLYGNQSSCIDDFRLKKFCFCK